MKRALTALALLTTAALGTGGVLVPSAQADPAPVRTLVIGGTEVGSYPAFDAGTHRYAATTTSNTAGSLEITASTTDPSGTVTVNGDPANGPVTVSGLSDGDQVSVEIDDATGDDTYTVVYLPAGFPQLDATTTGATPEGEVALTLNTFGTPAGLPAFEAIVDRNGVPTYVAPAAATTLDLKKQPDGELSVSRPTTAAAHSGTAQVSLSDTFVETARRDIVPVEITPGHLLQNTDSHDSERLPDGSTVLIGYEGYLGKTHAIIQRLAPNGQPDFTWTSAPYADETTADATNVDYAHINSVQTVGAHRDILASFRHFSSVFLIATEAHDGHQPGDVIWKLGGRDSSFTFPDDPDGGPCAQHTASELPNGHVLVYDNGGTDLGPGNPSLCLNPADRGGATINRARTRVAEYALDLTTMTAHLVWSYDPSPKFAFFAGSARRLANGDTLIGWASDRAVLATQVNAAKQTVWELKVHGQSAGSGYMTYRASLIDTDAPSIQANGPANGAQVRQGQVLRAAYSCSDGGGAGVRSCAGSVPSGAALSTATVGKHMFTVTGTDAQGNTATLTRSYTVLPPLRSVDGAVWWNGWKGAGVHGPLSGQTVRAAVHGHRGRITATVLARNTGSHADTIEVTGSRSNRWFDVRYYVGASDVTKRVTAGTFRSPRLAPGSTVRLRVVLIRKSATPAGRTVTVVVRAASVSSSTAADRVAVVGTARRPS